MSYGNPGPERVLEMSNMKVVIKFAAFIIILAVFGLGFDFLGGKVTELLQSSSNPTPVVAVGESVVETPATPTVEPSVDIQSFGQPIKIEINSVGINLPVQLGEYNYTDKTWTIEKYKAYFASLSDIPNEKNSHTVIYAHNQKSEFYNLKNLSVGDEIVVTTVDGFRLTYKMDSYEFVDPNWGGLFDQEYSESHLTLITCSGSDDEYRRLVRATLVSVVKN